MTENKHTPGPWEVHSLQGAYYWVSDAESDGQTVCVFNHREMDRPDEIPANARLIAAAPDLLEACEASLEALSETIHCIDLRRQLKRVIAKARGD